MNSFYIMDDLGNPVQAISVEVWAKWFEKADRTIARSECNTPAEPETVLVSTVFIGIDQSFGRGLPLIYETMVFGGKYDQHQNRYSTLEDSLAGHAETVAMVMDGVDEDGS